MEHFVPTPAVFRLSGIFISFINVFMKTNEPITPDQASLDEASSAREILMLKFEEAKARNSRLSLRAFAQKLDMSSGSLSELMSGKRTMTMAIKKKIADKIILSPKETLNFFEGDLPDRMTGDKNDERVTLSQDQFHLVSDWWYFALL